MKKKILSFIMVICLIIPCALILSACGGNTSSGNISSMSKEELATTFKSLALDSWQQLGAGDPTVQATATRTLSANEVSLMSINKSSLPSEMEEQTGDTVLYIKETGATMMAYVYMLGEYYENENFVVSDKVVTFNVNVVDPNSKEIYTSVLSFLPKIYKDDNRVSVEMFLSSNEMQSLGYSKAKAYYLFDIGFDFNNNKLLSYYFLNIQKNIKNNGEDYEEFTEMGEDKNGKCFGNVKVSDDFKNACRDIFNDFNSRKEQGLTLSGNFDEEFNRYGDRANKACQNIEKEWNEANKA